MSHHQPSASETGLPVSKRAQAACEEKMFLELLVRWLGRGGEGDGGVYGRLKKGRYLYPAMHC
jgi:hypothetical protein